MGVYSQSSPHHALIPARFLTLTAHVVLLITLLWSRQTSVDICLTSPFSDSTVDDVVVALSLGLASAAIEFFGFFSGISTFFPTVSLLSFVAHASASIGLSLVVFEDLPCSSLWFILGFCSLLPAVVEIVVVIGVVGLKKSILWPKVERRSWWKRRKKTEKKK